MGNMDDVKKNAKSFINFRNNKYPTEKEHEDFSWITGDFEINTINV